MWLALHSAVNISDSHVSVLSAICPPTQGFLPYFWIWLLKIGCSSPNSKVSLNSIY